MQSKKKADVQDFQLAQVQLPDDFTGSSISSYEVLDPKKEIIGRFGSLREAQRFLDLLRHIE